MNLHKKLLCTAGVALLLSSTNLFGADKSARDVINNAYQYLGSMDKYSFTAVVSEDAVEDGTIVKTYKQNVLAKVSRPNKLRVDTKGDVKNRSNYLNNGLYTMMDHDFGFYGQIKTPKSIDGALDFIFTKFGIQSPMASLFYSDMNKRVKFKTSKYFGTMDVAGTECDYVAFKNNTREIHAWIATGDKPLVKTYSIIDTGTNGNPRMNTSLTWSNASISDSDFVFKAPKGASMITVNSSN